jgi:DNA-binding XRE family transcriptional regulator
MKASVSFDKFLEEQLKDPEFAKEYEKADAEFQVIRAILDARTSQNLTQEDLAKKTGINRSEISKLENGTRNPSIKLLQKLASGLNMHLELKFVPNK